jgi:molybdopterin-guanine dinucleotide biosynthesis protein A
MAGGGVREGLRYGGTDEIGLMAVDRPVPFRDLHATILAALGLEHEKLTWEVNGRLERLTGVQNTARVIPDVLG